MSAGQNALGNNQARTYTEAMNPAKPLLQSAETLLEPAAATGEQAFDMTLRPKRLEEFVGQAKLRENLSIFISAAKMRGVPREREAMSRAASSGRSVPRMSALRVTIEVSSSTE